jgi:hypothetical protein
VDRGEGGAVGASAASNFNLRLDPYPKAQMTCLHVSPDCILVIAWRYCITILKKLQHTRSLGSLLRLALHLHPRGPAHHPHRHWPSCRLLPSLLLCLHSCHLKLWLTPPRLHRTSLDAASPPPLLASTPCIALPPLARAPPPPPSLALVLSVT